MTDDAKTLVNLSQFHNRAELQHSVIVTRYAPRVVVEQAAEDTWMTLGLLATADQNLLFISDDVIHVGNTPDGVEVLYRVVGWDAERKALKLRREQ